MHGRFLSDTRCVAFTHGYNGGNGETGRLAPHSVPPHLEKSHPWASPPMSILLARAGCPTVTSRPTVPLKSICCVTTTIRPLPVLCELRNIVLHPPHDRGVRQIGASFGHHRPQVSIAQFIGEGPSYAENDDLAVKVATLEQDHRGVTGWTHRVYLSRQLNSCTRTIAGTTVSADEVQAL